MRTALAAAAMLLVVAACGDSGSAGTTAAPVPPPSTTATVPQESRPAETTVAPPTSTATSTTTGSSGLTDVDRVTDCAGLVDAGLALLQAVFDALGDATLADLEEGTLPGLDLLETEGQKLDARADDLGCDSAELEAGLFARIDELEPTGELSQLILAGFAEELPDPDAAPDVPDGVEFFEVDDASHTADAVSYPQDPPVGGPHDPVWLNCGFYSEPVRTEHAVHSLEHGAVWITYDAGRVAAEELDALRALAGPTVLVSPYEGLGESAVVASVWGAQLRLESPLDARLEQFIASLGGATAPEPGAPCEGGIGDPE